jgi:hypothetical protein
MQGTSMWQNEFFRVWARGAIWGAGLTAAVVALAVGVVLIVG